MYAPGQRETTLQCNVVSHWLGAFTKWSLDTFLVSIIDYQLNFVCTQRAWAGIFLLHWQNNLTPRYETICKTEWSYVHTCAERLRSGNGRISTFPLRYRRYVHTYAERTRADLPFLKDNVGLEREVSNRTRKIGCRTHLLRSGFCSRSASAPRPRMCERM